MDFYNDVVCCDRTGRLDFHEAVSFHTDWYRVLFQTSLLFIVTTSVISDSILAQAEKIHTRTHMVHAAC